MITTDYTVCTTHRTYILSNFRLHVWLIDVHSPACCSPPVILQLLLIYLPRKDERLSQPGWLTYSGRFTHISGHPSAAGQAQGGESSPVKNQRSSTVQRKSDESYLHDLPSLLHCPTQNLRDHRNVGNFVALRQSPYNNWASNLDLPDVQT